MHHTAILATGASLVAALATGFAAPPGTAARPPDTFGDWLSPTGTAPGISLSAIVEKLSTPPLRPDGVTTIDGPVSFTRSALPTPDVVQLAPDGKPAPTATQVDGGTDSEEVFTQWCYYWWTEYEGSPPPPAEGDSYGLARADINGFSYTQAVESNGGAGAGTEKSKAHTTHSLPITLPDSWPQPARIIGVVNPVFKGMQYVDSDTSILYDHSTASNKEKIRFGWEYNGFTFWDKLWSFSHEASDGQDYLYTHTWDGNPAEGEFAYIDAAPSRQHTFKFRVDSTAKTETKFLAGALSQVDWGSLGLSAPSLGPDNFVRTDTKSPAHALIGYEVPDGYGVIC